MTTRRQFLHLAGSALAAPALPGLAGAQSWPAKPIRAKIPFSAGSSLDIVGRIVLDPLSSQLGQPIVVENRGGGGETIGSAMVAKADADGYTILINASAHSAAPACQSVGRHRESLRRRPSTRRRRAIRWTAFRHRTP